MTQAIDVRALREQILKNRALKTQKEKAAALYGAIACLAFTGNVDAAKEFAALAGCKW